MGEKGWQTLDPEIEECLERFRGLRSSLPRSREPFDLFLLEWAAFKRRAANVAAECLSRLLPGLVKSVYYLELADSYAGRDVDLVVDLDDRAMRVDLEEVEATLEALLSRLAEMAAIEVQVYTTSPSLFEVHIAARGVYGSRTLPGHSVQLLPRPGTGRGNL
ncbi:hypothetical protein CF15_03100 [Pyrodictium occultum]|uniref:Uncharacterized protein n=1 Tax=Pyrodictium occultum TaxID=2309 RepID=A0A0V8RUV6_PYROC|nr:hypothetical protein [Pyrodictium occultum]KSW11805.1 hypothetical protein CF15_03100 [Pyrodictium occultum]